MPPSWAGDLFRRIAVPRLVGTPALAEASAAVVSQLEAWGYRVHREEFLASPRRLTAVSLGATGAGWIALLAIPLIMLPVPGFVVLVIVAGLLGLAGGVALGVAAGHLPVGPSSLPAQNIVATFGERPDRWIVAHLDSKSQRFSLRSRIVAVHALAAGLAGLLAVVSLRVTGPVPWPPVFALAGLVAGAAGILSRGEAANKSSGAVDNASGVIAVLAAAHAARESGVIGVLVTSAEEFGMEGARAWCRTHRPGAKFVNVDGLDGRGRYRVMRHRGCRAETANSLARALAATGIRAKIARLPPGVLVDGVLLARSGMQGVTVSRGDWSTLGAVHTAWDHPERVDLAAVVDAGQSMGRWLAAQQVDGLGGRA